MANFFRVGVSITLLLIYTAIMLASIVGTALPIATFSKSRGTNGSPTLSLWENCTHTNTTACTDITFDCSRSRDRFNTARAFTILTIIFSFLAISCSFVALVQLICYRDVEAGVKALRGCLRVGMLTLVLSIVAVAMVIVVSTEPLCEGSSRIENIEDWELGGGAISTACCACFALFGACVGRILESRISTSTLGV
jgi:hypothetical protein